MIRLPEHISPIRRDWHKLPSTAQYTAISPFISHHQHVRNRPAAHHQLPPNNDRHGLNPQHRHRVPEAPILRTIRLLHPPRPQTLHNSRTKPAIHAPGRPPTKIQTRNLPTAAQLLLPLGNNSRRHPSALRLRVHRRRNNAHLAPRRLQPRPRRPPTRLLPSRPLLR